MKRFLILTLAAMLFTFIFAINGLSAPAKITLRLSDNIPDRNHGWGVIIEQINAEFKKNHPQVELVTESLQDQAYQQKIKIYAASNQLPDIMKYWSFSSMMPPLINNGYIMPLDRKAWENFNFLAGALDSNTYHDNLYGLPVTADVWLIYYNKALFEKYQVKLPTTTDELIAAAKIFRSNQIIPVVTDGRDAWPLTITKDMIFFRQTGDYSLAQQALDRKITATHPAFLNAAKEYRRLIEAKVFNDDLLTTDYGAAKNLFGQERAAMYIMGNWEMSIASDTSFSEHFRKNLGVLNFPAVKGGKGNVDDIFCWFGGNYIVNARTKYKSLCLDYLKTYFTMYPNLTWKAKATFPAQKVQTIEEDNEVAQAIVAMTNNAKRSAGPPLLDKSTDEFKQLEQKYVSELTIGLKTPEQYVEALDKAMDKAALK